MKTKGFGFAALLFVLLCSLVPSFTSAATLYSQPDHSQLVYAAPAALPSDAYWATVKFTVAETAQPRFWWLNATLPKQDNALTFYAPGQPPSCTIRFEQTLTPGWVRAYAAPDCVTGSVTRADLPTYGAGSTLQLLWLGALGAGAELYGGGTPQAGQAHSCYNELTGGDACTAAPALFVTDDPNATPESGVPAPFSDTATHLTGTYYSGYAFTLAGSPYVIDGPVYIRQGTVTFEPGVVVKFRNSVSSLTVHGDAPFVSQGTAENPVTFTSYKDDSHGGDTNGDGAASQPQPGDWGYLSVGCNAPALGDTRDYIRVYYGGALQAGVSETFALTLCDGKTLADPFAARTTRHIEVAHNLNGLMYANQAYIGHVTDSSIHDNGGIGATALAGPGYGGTDFVGNWWGSASGPRSLDNPGGTGDQVQGNFATVPFLTEDPFAAAPQPPIVTNLTQLRQFSTSTIPAGGDFIGNGITLQADVSDADSTQVTLEVEVKPVGVPFDGTGVQQLASNLPTGTTTIPISVDNLAPIPEQYAGDTTHAFHWRARAVDFEENMSEWQEFSPSATSFSVTHTLGLHASNLAHQVIGAEYLGDGKTFGGKGWHYDQHRYVSTQEIIDEYTYWNMAIGAPAFGKGLDCSGLVLWSFNRSYNPNLQFEQNAVRAEGADGQYLNTTYTISAGDLKPGDLLFFGTNKFKSHVAMYVGEFEKGGQTLDVIEAKSRDVGIVASSKTNLTSPSGSFQGYRRVAFGSGIAGYLQGGSPIDLTVTDPDGFVISATTSIQTDQEFLREVPGELYYSEMVKGHDGRPAPLVYWPKHKVGAYHISVTPQPGVSPSDTYSLAFTNGSTTVELARDLPVSQIPPGGYRVTVAADGAVTVDAVPPEARIGFDILAKTIRITGTDAVSSTTISTTATSSMIIDAAGNWLLLKLSNTVQKSSYASLSVPSLSYSTGTTTSTTTTLRYFWSTNTAGEYTLMVSAIRTPTERTIWLYMRPLNKTYVITATAQDDAADLLTQVAALLLRKKLQTYNGMIAPYVKTDKGSVLIGY